MTERIRNLLAYLKGQFWIIPLIMSVAASAAGFVLLDPTLIEGNVSWAFSGDYETARTLISTILSGLLTMTSLVVSITFVILTLASSQLGPRLVLNFISDRQIQFVIGLFIATAMFCIVVLRGLDGSLDKVPQLPITTATILIVICLLALLFYVHKIGRAIIADTVVAQVSRHLHNAVDTLRTTSDELSSPAAVPPLPPRLQCVSIAAAGYTQTIDYDGLAAIACDHDVVIAVPIRAGQFLLPGGEHVFVHGTDTTICGKLDELISDAIVIGPERSPAQDLEFSIRQLVEVALRALSPSINDPFTAMAVIDRLVAALEAIDKRALPSRLFRDVTGRPRVVAVQLEMGDLVSACFTQLRQAAGAHTVVLTSMASSIGDLCAVVAPALRVELVAELERLIETAENAPITASDRQSVVECARDALRRCTT